MEPLSVAAATIQFIDFTSRLISKGAAIHSSRDGLLVDHRELESITTSLSEGVNEIQASLAAQRSYRRLTTLEKEQERIGVECQSVAKELLDALNRLKSKGSKSRWKTFRQALKATWNDDKVQGLEKRLDRFRQQMVSNLLATLRDDVRKTAREQASIRGSVRKMEADQRESISVGERLVRNIGETERWHRDIIRAIYDQHHSSASVSHFLNSDTRGDWAKVQVKLNRERILKNLGFRHMKDRERRIPKAYKKTFEWIFKDCVQDAKPWSNFKQFLEQSNSDIYWITGKPGSGKSTLMKYIRYHPATDQLLTRWAGNDEVIRPAFYFWNSGWEMQMSVEGLLQTILRECLEAIPSAIEKIMPDRWEAVSLFGADDLPWNWQELSETLKRLILEICPHHRFFFMIDGLDECSGDHAQLIELILDLAETSSNVKICVASRPWTSFDDAFRGRPKLMLEHLTHDDIKHYISSRFGASEGFCELKQREPRYSDRLLDMILKRAEGVFLWVYLVVQSLLQGLTNGDRVRDLEDRLSQLPPNLEDLFKKILESLDEKYLSHASQLFQIVRAAGSQATLLTLAFADFDDASFALNAPVEPMDPVSRYSLCKTMRRRLVSRTRGLLDISAQDNQNMEPDLSDIPYWEVQYLHRSVKDFIETTHVWDWIVSLNTEPFNVHKGLFKAYLLQLKTRGPMPAEQKSLWEYNQENMLMCIRCIRCGKMALETAESGSDDIHDILDLFDEVDMTAQCLLEQLSRCGRTGSVITKGDHWSSCLFSPGTKPSFITLTAIFGVHQYLQKRLRRLDLIENGDDNPLLCTVLDPERRWKGIYISELERPDPKTIEVILRKGADCNVVFSKESVWDTLETCHISSQYQPERHAHYKKLRKILSQYLNEQPGAQDTIIHRHVSDTEPFNKEEDRSDIELDSSTRAIASPRNTYHGSATHSTAPQRSWKLDGGVSRKGKFWANTGQPSRTASTAESNQRHKIPTNEMEAAVTPQSYRESTPLQSRSDPVYPAYTTLYQHQFHFDHRYQDRYSSPHHIRSWPSPPWQRGQQSHWFPRPASQQSNQYYGQNSFYAPPFHGHIWHPPTSPYGYEASGSTYPRY